MRTQVSPFDVLSRTFWAGPEPLESDIRLRPIADCVGDTLPTIARLGENHTNRQIMWALIAIVVDMSLDDGDAELTAAILRSNARLLEVQGGADLFGTARRLS